MTKNWFIRCALTLTSALLVLASLPGHTQSSFATRPRVTARVEDSLRTRLQGNVSPVIRVAVDQGEPDLSAQITHMRLVLNRSSEQKAAFESYLAQLQDKHSPNYHKWLTPQQIGKLYGPADSDIAAATAWLESHGLKVETIAPFRIDIPFSGTIAQVEEAFQVQMHGFVKGDQHFFANVTAPTIPTALAPIVAGIAHLNTMPPRSFAHRGGLGTYNVEKKRNVAVSPSGIAHPDLTTGSSNSDYGLYVVPGDAATIYDTPNTTFNANYKSGTSYTGAGVTIGIGGDSGIDPLTVLDYRTRFLGDNNASKLLYTNVDGVAENSDEVEAYLDTEISGGLAPGATIHYYPSSDLISGIVQAFTDNTVDIFSLSFGNCEYFLPTVENQELYQLWQTAAAEGIAVTVSTGDSGSAGCDYPTDNSGNNVPAADVGLQVSGFASTPWNIAVGGTDFDGLIGNFATYAPAGSDTSANYFRSATKYIPESTWNDSTQADGKLSANTPYTGSNANIVAGSGGKSSCSTNTDSIVGNSVNLGTCTSGYQKPVWQRGTGVPTDGVRDLPDVSLMAGNGADAATWLVCTDDTGQNSSNVTVTANCADQPQANNDFYFLGVGGTSAATPAFAGILALVQQKAGGRLGQAAVELYDLYNGGKASSIFHDITLGNNSVACDSGTPNCSKNTAGFYFETGYDTTPGYDLATGIGSVDAAQLVANWGTGIGASAPTIKLTPGATQIQPSASLSVAVTVTGSYSDASGNTLTPTGAVTLTSGSYSSGAKTLTGGGTYSFTIPGGTLTTEGANTLKVAYSGDEFYGSGSNTATVTVLAPLVSLSATTLDFGTVLDGVTSSAKILTITNTGNAALTVSGVSITGTNKSSFAQTNNCASVAANGTCTISVTFTPAAAGAATAMLSITDNASGSPQTVALTGAGAVPAPIVNLSPSTLSLSAALGASASGNITLKNTGTDILNIGSIAVSGATTFTADSSACSATLAINASCVIKITFTPIAFGGASGTLTVTDNASGSPHTVSLSGTGTEPTGATYTLSAAAVTLTAGATTGNTSTITATGTNGYVGPSTVNLTCALTTSPTGAVHSPTCTATPITIAAGSGTGSGTVTISSTAASASVQKAANTLWSAGTTAGGFIAAAGLLLLLPGRMRRWRALLGAFLLVASIGVLSGCGGGGGSSTCGTCGGGGTSNPGTTKGAYTFTVTGKDAFNTSASATLNLTVN